VPIITQQGTAKNKIMYRLHAPGIVEADAEHMYLGLWASYSGERLNPARGTPPGYTSPPIEIFVNIPAG
jgi:hypothetical protein